jgi:hypothetical protein
MKIVSHHTSLHLTTILVFKMGYIFTVCSYMAFSLRPLEFPDCSDCAPLNCPTFLRIYNYSFENKQVVLKLLFWAVRLILDSSEIALSSEHMGEHLFMHCTHICVWTHTWICIYANFVFALPYLKVFVTITPIFKRHESCALDWIKTRHSVLTWSWTVMLY